MTIQELRDQAKTARDNGSAKMVLVLYRKSEPRGEFVRLANAGSPSGRFVGAEKMPDGQVKVVADFFVADIIYWTGRQLAALD